MEICGKRKQQQQRTRIPRGRKPRRSKNGVEARLANNLLVSKSWNRVQFFQELERFFFFQKKGIFLAFSSSFFSLSRLSFWFLSAKPTKGTGRWMKEERGVVAVDPADHAPSASLLVPPPPRLCFLFVVICLVFLSFPSALVGHCTCAVFVSLVWFFFLFTRRCQIEKKNPLPLKKKQQQTKKTKETGGSWKQASVKDLFDLTLYL